MLIHSDRYWDGKLGLRFEYHPKVVKETGRVPPRPVSASANPAPEFNLRKFAEAATKKYAPKFALPL